MLHLSKDFREFVHCLNEAQVKYLVVGAHALAAHGRARYTGDLDVFVASTEDNARKLVDALAEFGFPNVPFQPFTEFDRILTLGHEPLRIDVFTHIPGLDFEESWSRKEVIPVKGLRVNVVSRIDFVTSKKASGRPKDLLDIELLKSEES